MPAQGQKHELDAADFMADAVAQHPGEVCILALGPLTNLALAMQRHPALATHVVSAAQQHSSSIYQPSWSR
jgi:inosine-uridine nucleoside N-ribohydrolase